nr:hypothetical protein [uncultured Pseudomonas sp.]
MSEINRILQESEGRPSPKHNEPGHALALHFDARGLALSDRVQPHGRAIGGGYPVRVPLPRPVGNAGHQSISSMGRPFIMGSTAMPGPAERQDVLDTWANYELEQAKTAKVARIAQLRASNKAKSIVNAAKMEMEPPLTDISSNKKKELNLAYEMDFEGAEFSGAFADRQQAAQIPCDLLNSANGQRLLAELDGGKKKRVEIHGPVPKVIDNHAVKIHLSSRDTLGGDTPVLTDISSAYMVVDSLPTGDIHIQTFFPIA